MKALDYLCVALFIVLFFVMSLLIREDVRAIREILERAWPSNTRRTITPARPDPRSLPRNFLHPRNC
jgi:hypothetical protein